MTTPPPANTDPKPIRTAEEALEAAAEITRRIGLLGPIAADHIRALASRIPPAAGSTGEVTQVDQEAAWSLLQALGINIGLSELYLVQQAFARHRTSTATPAGEVDDEPCPAAIIRGVKQGEQWALDYIASLTAKPAGETR